MADRGKLHVTKLCDFVEFLLSKDYKLTPVKGAYETLRVTKGGKVTIFHKRDESCHVTSSHRDGGTKLINEFFKVRK